MFGNWKHRHPGPEWERMARRRMMRSPRRAKYNVPVNIIERDEEFEVWVYALAFDKENIKVSVIEDTLYIHGKREPEEEYPNFLLHEYPIKSFERSFELSHRVDKSKIKAVYENGILKLKIGKSEAAINPEINIDVA